MNMMKEMGNIEANGGGGGGSSRSDGGGMDMGGMQQMMA
jgi:hypothetical protein